MIDTDDLERRLTDALDAAATTVPHTVAPSFSWQRSRIAGATCRATFQPYRADRHRADGGRCRRSSPRHHLDDWGHDEPRV